MSRFASLRRRLLRIPLLNKILIANSLIVTAGAIAGTVITVWHVLRFPDDVHYELIALFAAAGIFVSALVNNWVLRRTLQPLDRLQDAVDQVRGGYTDVRVHLGDNSDERFDRLAETFNQMLDTLELNAQRLQQLPQQILQAQEAERQRLARELHDEAAQALTSLLVHLRLLERAHTPDQAQKHVEDLRQLTAQALEEVRRVALDLRPTILDDLGLAAALEWRVDELNSSDRLRAEIVVRGLEERLPRDLELIFYRIGQEALSNVAKHAQASHVHLALVRLNGMVSLSVVDDGVGFDPGKAAADRASGLGLVGMRERIAMANGQLIVESARGQGTRIVATAPMVASWK